MNASGWENLFATPPTGPTQAFTLQVLRRAGEPLLVLPADPKLRKPALSLYPAQRFSARLAREALRRATGLGLPASLEKTRVTVSIRDPFVQFMASVSNHPDGGVPPFAIFAGNPQAPGRRFVVLVFDRDRQPVVTIKAGIGAEAQRLIDREARFLKSVPRGIPGVPHLLHDFVSDRIHAFAMNFVAGASPVAKDRERIESLLSTWVDTTRSQRFFEWTCHPVIFHGDFAPWNIRVSAGNVTVLDWERGAVVGVPGWDWFHYVMQPAILVQRQTAEKLRQTAEKLLVSDSFQAYAARAGIAGIERELFREYLAWCMKESKPPARLQELLNQWTSA